MSSFSNATVLITGGASGIGKLMGRTALQKGAARLVLWDINAKGLEETAKEFSSFSGTTHTYTVDVSNVESIVHAAEQTRREAGPIDILINNAGIVFGKYFHQHTHAEIDRIMSINSDALMHVTLEFLPAMIERKSGHLVTIASAGGMVGNPKMSTYVASKWSAIGWSDSVRIELEKLQTNVKVTCITPYYISTGMFAGVKSSIFLPITTPETAVRKILRGIEKDKLYVRMPLLVYTLQLVKGLLPTRWFDAFAGGFLKVYKTMDEFTGRTPK